MKSKIEAWELTAFALGELSLERATELESVIAADADLAKELAAICQTIGKVTVALHEPSPAVLQQIAPLPTTPQAAPGSEVVTPLVDRGTHMSIGNRRSWLEIVGLAVTAASLLVAGFFSNEVIFHSYPLAQMAPTSMTNEASNHGVSDTAPQVEFGTPIVPTGKEMDALAVSDLEENIQLHSEELRSQLLTDAKSVPHFAPGQPDSVEVLRELKDETSLVKKSEIVSNPAPVAVEREILAVDSGMKNQPGSGESQIGRGRMKGTTAGGMSGGMGMGGGMAGGGEGGMGGGMAGGMGMGGGMAGGGEGGMGRGGMGYGALGYEGAPAAPGSGIVQDEFASEAKSPSNQLGTREKRLYDLSKAERRSELMLSLTPRINIQKEEELAEGENLKRDENRGVNDRFDAIVENEFQEVGQSPFSTFSIDVDSASYTKTRQYLLEANRLPSPSAVRIEEMINYFPYSYAGPTGDLPFSSALSVAECPWTQGHQLVRIALQARKVENDKRPVSNLVFLLDVSGSMNEPNKLPLVKESMRMLIHQLHENDRVAMVVYAGAAGLVLESTTGNQREKILASLDRLSAGGSTNGGAGIQLAYQIARENFIPGGTNRIILCTDGDFNVGTTNNADLVSMVEENAKSKVFLTVLGFGMGNTNDSMMEQITNRGNGLYGFVDSELEARRMMVEQLSGSLITVAKDVKIQVEFNPQQVAGYRLIGYENRMLATQDFNNDKKDAGEIGAGHCVTALYEIVPAGQPVSDIPPVDRPRYQTLKELTPAAKSEELLVVKLRYKQPEGDKSSLLEFPLVRTSQRLQDADADFQWAASVAQFGMLLRDSKFKGQSSWDGLLEASEALADDSKDPYRQQAVDMMRAAKQLIKK